MRLKLLITIQERVAAVHPGIVLESPVQGWVFLRQFEQGIACYHALKERSGFDDRWAGVCYFHLHEDLRSVELFYRAIARGVDAARINLAHALAYIERGDEVIPELLKVNRDQLPIYDQVLYFRVKSLHEESSGYDLKTALQDAHTAWNLVQTSPHFSLLAPDILSQLAVLNGRIGKAQTALEFIDRNLAIATGVDALRARIHRARILITLGQFSEAITELEQLRDSPAPKHLVSIIQVYLGEAEWALGNLDRSIAYFTAAATTATELDIGFEEFLARTSLALLHAVNGHRDTAFEQLSHAERLVGDRSDRLYFRFREIFLSRKVGSMSATEAITGLRTVATELGKMGALQEQGWVRLHVAHELWKSKSVEFQDELDELRKLSLLLQNPAFLTRELTLMPEFAEIVEEAIGFTRSRKVLRIRTLGDEALHLDGVPVHLPLRRGVELLTYFLEHKTISLKTLLHELFPDEKPRTARSYFHQFRFQLCRNIDGLSIAYDRKSRRYSLERQDVAVYWDVEALRAGDDSLLGRTFLPSATSQWAQRLNAEILNSLEYSS